MLILYVVYVPFIFKLVEVPYGTLDTNVFWPSTAVKRKKNNILKLKINSNKSGNKIEKKR